MKELIKLPSYIQTVLSTLQSNGFDSYVVGGCVRDFILGHTPHDWDVCTSAKPLEIKEIFKNFQTIDTGLKHGTVTVLVEHEPIEITTFRIDGKYEDNRRPSTVEFTSDIIEDLKRRDFTINAIAYNNSKGIVDPFNGMKDIENKIIRCVGNPIDRLNEDALRILRALRFSCKLNFDIEEETSCQLINLRENLLGISKERICSEFSKMIVTENFCKIMKKYYKIFAVLFPEISEMVGFDQNNPYHIYDLFDHTVEAIKNAKNNNLEVKLALFFHDFGKLRCKSTDEMGISHYYQHHKISKEMANEILRDYRFDNNTIDTVTELIYLHDVDIHPKTSSVKRIINKLNERLKTDPIDNLSKLLIVKEADILAQNPIYLNDRLQEITKIREISKEIVEKNECFSIKDLEISGHDIIKLGEPSGPNIGYILNTLLNEVINDQIENDHHILINEANKLINLEK